jgi:glycosyltransferase involved in cell wall biosynthesis
MRILHVIEDVNPATGGPATVVARLAAAQAAMGHTVNVLGYLAARNRADFESAIGNVPGIDKVYIETLAPSMGLQWAWSLPARQSLHRLVPRADVTHIHGVWDPIVRVTSEICRRYKTPYVIRPCGMLDPWALQQRPMKKRLAMALAYRDMIDGAMFLHVLNADEFRLVNLLSFRNPLEIIPNGVFPEELDKTVAPGAFRRARPEIGDAPYVLFLSRLHYKKGLDYLIDAFAQVAAKRPDVRLVVAGPDGGERRPLVARAKALGLTDRVHVVGPLYGSAKYAALNEAACFCLPSRQEGFSLAITEALGMGVPAVISTECHFPEVTTTQSGHVTPLDAGEIARALLDVLADPVRRDAMGRAGAKMVRERYTWPKIARRTVACYEEQLGRIGRAVPPPDDGPLRVLHVINSMAVSMGGPPFVAAGLAAAQAQGGHAITIASTATPGEPRVQLDPKVSIVEFPVMGSKRYLGSPALDIWLRAHAADFDILHLHSIWQFPTFAAARACWLVNKPYVVLLNGMLDRYSVYHRSRWMKSLYWHWRERRVEQTAGGVHFLNTAEIRKAVPWVGSLRKFVIGNGISQSELSAMPARGFFRAANPAIGGRPLVLFLSRIHPKKGLERLLPEWKRVVEKRPDVVFAVAGKGEPEHEKAIDELIARHGLQEHVLRVGQLAGRRKWEALVDADVFVLPSHQEGFSMAITEALAAGCVPVVTEECNFDELEEFGCGVIIPHGDMPAFTQAVLELLDDPERRRQLAERGRKLVAERYVWEKIAADLERAYRWILAGRPIPVDGAPVWRTSGASAVPRAAAGAMLQTPAAPLPGSSGGAVSGDGAIG